MNIQRVKKGKNCIWTIKKNRNRLSLKKSAKELTFCCHDKVTSSSSARSVDRPKVKLELSAVPLPPLSATELPPPPPAIVPLSTLLTVSDPLCDYIHSFILSFLLF